MKKRKLIWIAVVIAVVAAVFVVNSPKNRAAIFVKLNHERIEEGLSLNACVPADDALLFGYRSVNTWEGDNYGATSKI